jgi:hypothetical protein
VMMPASAAVVRLSPRASARVKARRCHQHQVAPWPRFMRASWGSRSERTMGLGQVARHGQAEEHENIPRDRRGDHFAKRHVGAGERHRGDEGEGGEDPGWHEITLAPGDRAGPLVTASSKVPGKQPHRSAHRGKCGSRRACH